MPDFTPGESAEPITEPAIEPAADPQPAPPPPADPVPAGIVAPKKWSVGLTYNKTVTIESETPIDEAEAIRRYNDQMGITKTAWVHSAEPIE